MISPPRLPAFKEPRQLPSATTEISHIPPDAWMPLPLGALMPQEFLEDAAVFGGLAFLLSSIGRTFFLFQTERERERESYPCNYSTGLGGMIWKES